VWVVPRLSSEHIKQLSKSVGEKAYGERFVQLKIRLSEAAGVEMVPNFWLPPEVIEANNADFVHLSFAFDRLLYKSGKRKTTKDQDLRDDCLRPGSVQEEGENKHLLRHNMCSNSFIFRELTYKNAKHLFELASADFFWPLPKTTRVLANLIRMYNILADYCMFPPSMLTSQLEEGKLKPGKQWKLEDWWQSCARMSSSPAIIDRNLDMSEWKVKLEGQEVVPFIGAS